MLLILLYYSLNYTRKNLANLIKSIFLPCNKSIESIQTYSAN